MEYDPEWMIGVLKDLSEFCEANGLPYSKSSIDQALSAVILEIEEQGIHLRSDRDGAVH